MEWPIKIIMVLFTALVVASLIILLASNTVDNAKRQMRNLGKTNPEKIIDKGTGSVSAVEIVYLARSCKEILSGNALAEELCYVVHGNVQTDSSALQVELNKAGVRSSTESFSPGVATILLYYDPINGIVNIKK